jgi:nucleoside-diphosphate-sugar epimerase
MTGFVIIGCGYVGERLARRLPGPVTALVRTPERAAELRASGIDALPVDVDVLTPGSGLTAGTEGCVLFYLAPPPGDGPDDPRLRNCLAALRGLPARIVYMSTTGVYGDAGGAVVDEDSPPAPTNDRARARIDAERAVRDFCGAAGVEWVVLRVPGIYGPGRLPLERLRRGDPVVREDEAGPGNRIHVDDLVRACIAAGTEAAAADRVYNVGDGRHASTTCYLRTVARCAGLPEPPEVSRKEARKQMSPLAWSFLGDSRQVDSSRMERELGVEIRYRDLEAGVRASLGRDQSGAGPGAWTPPPVRGSLTRGRSGGR